MITHGPYIIKYVSYTIIYELYMVSALLQSFIAKAPYWTLEGSLDFESIYIYTYNNIPDQIYQHCEDLLIQIAPRDTSWEHRIGKVKRGRGLGGREGEAPLIPVQSPYVIMHGSYIYIYEHTFSTYKFGKTITRTPGQLQT